MATLKAQEAGYADDDNISESSVTSSFVDIRRASPAPSVNTAHIEHDAPTIAPSVDPPSYAEVNHPPHPRPGSPQQSSSWTEHDPRSASTESLGMTAVPHDRSRRMLLVYIHGFMGNETSFQSFPAHVHNLLSVTLSESHVVHTKIYPKYRTKKALRFAAEDFSQWLFPNQDSMTDVVLLGHSLGGLLATDVALLRDQRGEHLRHRLLGTISFDSPFLGMHPGVVLSGISSLFRPAPSPTTTPSPGDIQHPDTLTQVPSPDPHYNPTFANDVQLPIRTGWANTRHFVGKHYRHLHHAVKQSATAHWEFGGELADNKALKRRYAMVKALDSEDDAARSQVLNGHNHPKRTRFTNYYTACHGRPKKPKPSEGSLATPSEGSLITPSTSTDDASLRARSMASIDARSGSPSQRSQSAQDADTSSVLTVSTTGTTQSGADTPRGSIDMASPSDPQAVRPPSTSLVSPRPSSPAPSYTTLPPYTSDLSSPAPSYPPSRPPSTITSPSRLGLNREDSSSSDLSSITTGEPLQEPEPLDKPPVPSDYPGDPAAFREAMKVYLQTAKQYAHALKAYHKQQYKVQAQQRKAEAQNRTQQRKCSLAALEEERKLEKQLRDEELKRIAEAPTEEARKVEVQAMHDRRRREIELKREQVKKQVEEEKERGKADREAAKIQRKLVRNNLKEERKATKDRVKEQVNAAKNARKCAGGSTGSSAQSPGSLSQGSPVLFDADDRTVEPESYDSGSVDMRATSQSSTAQSPQMYPPEKVSQSSSQKGKEPQPAKKQKDKKFCMLPQKDARGNRDPAWQRVFLQDVDEVGAHCGLFFPKGATGAEGVEGQAWGERYAWLVADVAERIETWAHDEMTERMVSGVEAL